METKQLIECPRCKDSQQAEQIIHAWFDEPWQAESIDAYSYYAHYDFWICGLCEGAAEVTIDHPAVCQTCKGTMEVNGEDCPDCELGYYPDEVGDIPIDEDEEE